MTPHGDELRWGILSTADIGPQKVIPGIQGARELRRRGDRVARWRARPRTVAAELGIERAHDSYEALLADPDVDAVYIPLPNHLHAEWTIAAARAGKHVLCEKPLAMTAADAEQMVDVCRAEGVTLMEAFMYRLHPSWVAVRELVGVRPDRPADRRSRAGSRYYNDDPTNIRNIRDAGGGALYDIGCYIVNLSRMLFGGGARRGSGGDRARPGEWASTRLTSAILEFDGGIATFTCSTRTETDQRVHVYGTEGRISIGIPFNIPPDRPTEIYVTAGGDPPVAPDDRDADVRRRPTRTRSRPERFAAAVLDGTPSPVPPATPWPTCASSSGSSRPPARRCDRSRACRRRRQVIRVLR